MQDERAARGTSWAAVAAAVAGVAVVLDALGAPTPPLLAGFAVGIFVALVLGKNLEPPTLAITGSQAVIGVTVGVHLERSTLSEVGGNWAVVVSFCLATLALSVLFGLVMPRIAPIDQATASFGMIAGGAAAIISISRQLGADERIVALLQYLRVFAIVALTPIVATALGVVPAAPHATTAGAAAWAGVGFLAACALVGVPLGRLVRMPAPALLGPMLVAAGLSIAGLSIVHVPAAWITGIAFAVVGLDVGLRFTPRTLRQAGSLLPAALAMTAVLIAVCAGLGVALSALAGVSRLDGYLATTPGGLSAVLALSVGSRTNTTFILSVQLIRTFVMVMAAPLLARCVVSLQKKAPSSTEQHR